MQKWARGPGHGPLCIGIKMWDLKGANIADTNVVYGYSAAQTMVQVL